jgi:glucosamine 6-phosphate synthetase-like amidotransferase/phosphosugar isomerase protein
MCGVLGLIVERSRSDLGRVAAELLKTLEYRGYDSTGALFQGDSPEPLTLLKGVGAPSVMVHELGIVDQPGRIFCGQVRWATFGAVTDANSQPHLVRCKLTMYGAHNGNVTNCDDLKAGLTSEGHRVLSDNDGEMVVHTIEHFFALELERETEAQRLDHATRRRAMRAAITRASARLEGSFAAVVVDPISQRMWAIKSGSSLYFGFGHDEVGGRFCIASSDLSSVLKLTRVLVPLREGEFVEYTADAYEILATRDGDGRKAGDPIEREPVRSRLRAKDTALIPPFAYFMDQEIAAQEATGRNVITMFRGGSDALRALRPCLDANPTARDAVVAKLDALLGRYDDDEIRREFHALSDASEMTALRERIPEHFRAATGEASQAHVADRLASSEQGFLADLVPMARGADDLLAVRVLDALLERAEVDEFAQAVERFVALTTECLARSGRVYVVCCGSSFHAAKAATLFFNEVACTELIPILPGEFRGQYSQSLRDGDLFVAVSQSGETKDLIDVLNQVIASGRDIRRVALVNNVNSTLAQEKSDVVIPLRCGPEVAVPATKSFMNQMVVFYCLALRLAERRLPGLAVGDARRQKLTDDLAVRLAKLPSLPVLIRETIASTDAEVERAAQMLYLAPSAHILATRITAVAREGALKVREVVLNHTEGFEGSEFKHGPNTILGFNTIFGAASLDALLTELGRTLDTLVTRATEAGLAAESVRRLVRSASDAVFRPTAAPLSLTPDEREVFDRAVDRQSLLGALYADYPLLYVTGPDERDVNLTVSAINTHKIRGASTVIIAEESAALRGAASKAPVDNPRYAWAYIVLPRTDDTLMTVFSSTVVLQRLALKMSVLKMQYLDRLGVKDHGVHPDVPKNVSKSITVD